jgi:hypothetical protein
VRIWPEGTIRGFGAVSVILGSAGAWLQLQSILRYVQRGPYLDAKEPPYFYGEATLDLLIVFGTVVAGIYLWNFTRRGRVISNVVFISEIFMFLGNVAVSMALMLSGGAAGRAAGLRIGAVEGIAHMGTAI